MIHMLLSSDKLNMITYLSGDAGIVAQLPDVKALVPFEDSVIEFLNDVSKELMNNKSAKAFSDVITFAFWIRKGSVLKLKERFLNNGVYLGRGVAFHIAPSNVPVNFAYSLVAGLLCGNANIVRVPSKDFPQVEIITNAFNAVLKQNIDLKNYIVFVRYDRDKEINDLLSSISDVRIIWGGDQTISELRKSDLPPRSVEVTFADRYSLAVIDSNTYLDIDDKNKVAEDFYNDTFFSDQNACTSPRIVVWTGDKIDEAKDIFWSLEHDLVKKKYTYQTIQGVNKLTKAFLYASKHNVKVENHEDNLIFRIAVEDISDDLMEYRDNSGYFYEYDCKDILDIVPLCNDKKCQTIAYIGDKMAILPIIQSGIKGVDRVVPMGKTMDFDLIWDGYNLPAFLTRTVIMF